MKTAAAIRAHLREELVAAIEANAAKAEDEEWWTGIPRARLEGRIILLQELLDWIEEKQPSVG